MRMSIVVAAAGAALALSFGCGKSTPTAPGSTTCSVTLSGAVTGTYNCAPANTGWSSSNNQGAFGFTVSSPAISVAIGWPGEPHTGTYTSSDAGASGGASVTTGSGQSTQAWAATTGSSPHGSYSLVFTSVSSAITVNSGKAYTAHGTVDATLVPLTGQSGNITLHATF